MEDSLYIPSVYKTRFAARGKERTLSKPLAEKWQYYGGKIPQVKKQTGIDAGFNMSQNKYYTKTLQSLVPFTNNYELTFEYLTQLISNIPTLNPHILATAIAFLNEPNVFWATILDDPEIAKKLYEYIEDKWVKIAETLKKDGHVSMEKQSIDIYHYIVLIVEAKRNAEI
mgnify:CR=1 FL=1|tara:strand:- start:305 stop:814 length:510 start_codon:yes stop_codon:yes gene_type:complete